MSTSEHVRPVIPAPRTSPENDPPPAPVRRRRLVPALLAAALALAVAATGLLVRAHQLEGAPATANRALVDTAATARVTGDVSSAVTRIFSYAPDTTAATRDAARRLLAGKAARQYGELFGQVEKRAAEQQLTLTTHVVRVAVSRLTDTSARLLLFLDQVAERRGKAPTTAAAQLTVAAELRADRWQIVDITSR
ncbi:hypothetical protein ACH41E_20495 [Streptomyces sp. NPDC020412]|uniref:hypothetical protein n=1 Tax=Streptomyces sp. NPDC020412 TaxID=3365073 RepID=UPI00379D4345